MGLMGCVRLHPSVGRMPPSADHGLYLRSASLSGHSEHRHCRMKNHGRRSTARLRLGAPSVRCRLHIAKPPDVTVSGLCPSMHAPLQAMHRPGRLGSDVHDNDTGESVLCDLLFDLRSTTLCE